MAIEVQLTGFGKEMMVHALSNQTPIHFTRMALGSGTTDVDISQIENLVQPISGLDDCPIIDFQPGQNYVQLTTECSNQDLLDDVNCTEIGLYAEDPLHPDLEINSSTLSDLHVSDATIFAAMLRMYNLTTYTLAYGDYDDDVWTMYLDDERVVFFRSADEFGMAYVGTPEIGDTISITVHDALFAYVNQADIPEPIYSRASNKLQKHRIVIVVAVDDTETISAEVSDTTYVPRLEFTAHKNATNNPHGVTKDQVGLGNVPNVSTNNQTPTFTIASSLTALTSGETLKTLFGKVAKAVQTLIAHLTDKSNPHGVTCAQVGASPATHNHNASQINAGVLAVARGGTGRESWTSNTIVYVDRNGYPSSLDRPSEASFLVCDGDNAPYFRSVTSIPVYAYGTSAPVNTNLLWVDTTPLTGGLKYYNGSQWLHVPVAYTT